METGWVIFLALVVLYTFFAERLTRLSITMPMVFVALGAVIGEHGLGLLQLTITSHNIELITEITLALLLFSDAAALHFREVREDSKIPGRLLGIGMPLIIILGAAAVFPLFPQVEIGHALLLATILAPTDAALGLAIFNNPLVPRRIRRALNVESGLNDGIASPLVLLFISISLEESGFGNQPWLVEALLEIGIGAVMGTLLGLAGGRLFKTAVDRGWTSTTAQQIGNLALALFVFFSVKELGGNGFVAVFVAGLSFGYSTRHLLHLATEYTEVSGTLLSVFVWTVFGAALAIPLFTYFDVRALAYALLSLTLVRMIPVAIALTGTRFRTDTRLMMGWLGPRGLASVVFLIISFDAAREANLPYDHLLAMGGWTILLSVLLHGLTALPLAKIYARRMENASPDAEELVSVAELSVRRRMPFSILEPKNEV